MATGTLLFYSEIDDAEAWRRELSRHAPELDIRVWPETGDPAEIDYALVWQPPRGFFEPFANLKLLINLGAGVDRLVARDDLPDIPITRIADPAMNRMMASYVLLAVLRLYRDFPAFERDNHAARWNFVLPKSPEDLTVGVMGLGQMGANAARELARQGFAMRGWARSAKSIDGIETFAGAEALTPFLSGLDILVVMLPLTDETRGLVGRDVLEALPRGAALVNVARGGIVDEATLLDLVRSGHVGEAVIDVFENEPLPADHPFWAEERVLVTPHVASISIPSSSAAQIVENIGRLSHGAPLLNRVEVARGY